MVVPYRAVLRATDPRRVPKGLEAYVRIEHRGDPPEWLRRPPRRTRRARTRRVTAVVRRAASALAAIFL